MKQKSDREKFVADLVGKQWVARAKGPDAYDCYSLAQHVQKELFDRNLPDFDTPNDPTWSYLINAIETHPERTKWEAISRTGAHPDGSLVLMATSRLPAHIGVWLYPERGVLHCNRPAGVTFDDLSTLHALGWHKLRFYGPL